MSTAISKGSKSGDIFVYENVCPTSFKLDTRTWRDASQQCMNQHTVSSLSVTHLLLAKQCIQQFQHYHRQHSACCLWWARTVIMVVARHAYHILLKQVVSTYMYKLAVSVSKQFIRVHHWPHGECRLMIAQDFWLPMLSWRACVRPLWVSCSQTWSCMTLASSLNLSSYIKSRLLSTAMYICGRRFGSSCDSVSNVTEEVVLHQCLADAQWSRLWRPVLHLFAISVWLKWFVDILSYGQWLHD